MPGTLTLDALRQAIDDGAIDTVIVAAIDMQGRLMGKRFHARHFADHGWRETHCCNYLLAVDMEMTPVPGYASANWAAGYGDYTVRPDLATLRRIPWAPGAALVLADLIDHHADTEVAISPRAILRRQIARARAMGYEPMMATELEFYLFDNSYESLRGGVAGLRPVSGYNEDYHIFQTAKVEAIMRAVRNGLHQAGVPVESTKGEAEAGQHEINIRYSDALDAADNHAITKAAIKEIAWAQGRSVTFMAKYDHRRAGSSAHVHQSLWAGGAPAFLGVGAAHAMAPVMQHYLAGQLAHAREIAAFLAPTVN
ncbi:MAG: glutamine synthetase family protein, partial [Gemmobacter sp.]